MMWMLIVLTYSSESHRHSRRTCGDWLFTWTKPHVNRSKKHSAAM
jgi:hypothetical protein